MKYFKIIPTYNSDEYLQIDETELDKAVYAHLSGKTGVFTSGTINGDAIRSVLPDFHRAMSWNRGYNLESRDWEELEEKGMTRKYRDTVNLASKKVRVLMESDRLDLLGKEIDLHNLESIKKLN